jgi:hypothetical protein
MLKVRLPKHSRIAQDLKRRAREQNLSPDDISIYPSRSVATTERGALVSKTFNSLAIPYRLRFSFKKLGKPFDYQGVMTKIYDVPALLALFQVNRSTLYAWIGNGYLPEPALRLSGYNERKFWFYHQVQPLFVWYCHMKARGIRYPCSKKTYPKEFKVLQRLLRMQERRWYTRLGLEYQDPYRFRCGKFGVIWVPGDVE